MGETASTFVTDKFERCVFCTKEESKPTTSTGEKEIKESKKKHKKRKKKKKKLHLNYHSISATSDITQNYHAKSLTLKPELKKSGSSPLKLANPLSLQPLNYSNVPDDLVEAIQKLTPTALDKKLQQLTENNNKITKNPHKNSKYSKTRYTSYTTHMVRTQPKLGSLNEDRSLHVFEEEESESIEDMNVLPFVWGRSHSHEVTSKKLPVIVNNSSDPIPIKSKIKRL